MSNIILNESNIASIIYLIRGKKVMLDRDLANLYGVKATRLREQVKRNLDRFPENFMFQLTENEAEVMVSQNAIPSKKHLGGYLPYVFTEHGVLMLAKVIVFGIVKHDPFIFLFDDDCIINFMGVKTSAIRRENRQSKSAKQPHKL